MIGLVFFILALAVFAFLSVRFGVDSRLESTDPRSPAHPTGIS
jgi:hypothetical protein